MIQRGLVDIPGDPERRRRPSAFDVADRQRHDRRGRGERLRARRLDLDQRDRARDHRLHRRHARRSSAGGSVLVSATDDVKATSVAGGDRGRPERRRHRRLAADRPEQRSRPTSATGRGRGRGRQRAAASRPATARRTRPAPRAPHRQGRRRGRDRRSRSYRTSRSGSPAERASASPARAASP